MPTDDLKKKLDAMVREKAISRHYEPGDPNPEDLVGIDLLQQLEERDERIKELESIIRDIATLVKDDPSAKARIITETARAALKEADK